MTVSRRSWLAIGGFAGAMALASRLPAQNKKPRGHVVLLGDSIFDNKVYVGNSPAVIDQVAKTLGDEWKATLLAVDGDVTNDVVGQMKKLPTSATHLILSVGGNDALMNQGILAARDASAAATFHKLAKVQNGFGDRYEAMLVEVLKQGKPTAVCTVYDPNYEDDAQNAISSAALSVFNDRITRSAFAHGIPVIDLRLLFSAKEDYANPIEPGPKGGAKIAEQIKRIVESHDFSKKQSVIYPKAS